MRVRIFLPAVLALAAGSVLLTGCGPEDDDSGAAEHTSSAPASSPADDGAAADESSPAPASSAGDSGAAAGDPVAVNKSFTDDVMGEKATVIKYVSGYQPSAAAKSKYSALADEQVVLVNVKVTASAKYYDSFGADSFYLTDTPNGIDQASTSILEDELKKAGYPPLADAETGKTTTGWVAFTPGTDLDHFVLRYKRLAASTSDGKDIPAKNFDTPLG